MLTLPLRQEQRWIRSPIKETLDACLSYDEETDGMRLNQYTLQREIGRGSFGAVHYAVDTDGNEYAIKEFSKSRLRRRSQAHLLRRPRGGTFSPGHRRSVSDIFREREAGNPLYLIREEIAILKKLDHPNIVRLYEVLDDPSGDSLYMVMEMCEKGAILDVDLGRTAVPYTEDTCRMWFRDMLLGVEYLHAQGIVHRDIKPDNLLVNRDDVLKIVDFGVSETFEKSGPMRTSKTAGSPAFVPPELCYVGHGDVSGTAVDVWSMGVTLYCLLFGCLPFAERSLMELCEAIKNNEPCYAPTVSQDVRDLLMKMLEKDPSKRITISEMREHPWVTRHGQDELLPYEENTAEFIATPNAEEVAHAVTKSIHNIMAVVRAVRKLKRLIRKRREEQAAAQQHNGTTSPTAPDNVHPSPSTERLSMESVSNALPTAPVDGASSPQPKNRPRSTTLPIIVTDHEILHHGSNDYDTHPGALQLPPIDTCAGSVPRSMQNADLDTFFAESPVEMDMGERGWVLLQPKSQRTEDA
ncbi:kinase-like protein [Ascodesmis nigricans]|uniref:Kinase-like protein n=1 Tax=Ascodesmis nigricans TaxID=341454 RepID=A0A4S2MX11_9PEZI|nr:kinase-like protein [Ascodesmis nigricans]